MRALAAIALGSNLESRFGDREANLREAVRRIGALGEVRAVSSFYDTEPVGYRGAAEVFEWGAAAGDGAGAAGVDARAAGGGAGDGAGAGGASRRGRG